MVEKIVRGQVAGLAATLLMTAGMLLFQLPRIDSTGEFLPVAILVRLYGTEGLAIRLLALVSHLLYGTVWGMIFVAAVPRGRVGSGLVFSLLPWLVLVLLLMPMMRPGFLASPDKPGIALMSLLMHLAYGASLGAANAFIFGRWQIECRQVSQQALTPLAGSRRP